MGMILGTPSFENLVFWGFSGTSQLFPTLFGLKQVAILFYKIRGDFPQFSVFQSNTRGLFSSKLMVPNSWFFCRLIFWPWFVLMLVPEMLYGGCSWFHGSLFLWNQLWLLNFMFFRAAIFDLASEKWQVLVNGASDSLAQYAIRSV